MGADLIAVLHEGREDAQRDEVHSRRIRQAVAVAAASAHSGSEKQLVRDDKSSPTCSWQAVWQGSGDGSRD